MYKMGVDDGWRVAPDQTICSPPIGVDAAFFVGNGDAEVEGVEWGGACAALTAENGMAHVAIARETVELEIGERVVGELFHGLFLLLKDSHQEGKGDDAG